MRRLNPGLPALVCALALSGPALAADAPRLLVGAGQARLELPSGERMGFELPEGAELTSVASLDDGWIAAGTTAAADRRELFLVRGREETVSPLAAPGDAGATDDPGDRLRAEPLPLVDRGRLAGLAWLEGKDRKSLAVRFAAWNGAGWEEPVLVSPPGPGSQLALTAARLGDGSWLLAWSAFDGEDDEIVWSRSSPGPAGAAGPTGWSRPRRLASDNRVPDVTPALTATPDGGALLAWNRHTEGGGYALVASRFQGSRRGRWSAPRELAASGALFPTFEASEASRPGSPRLLVRTTEPRGWALIELDAAGRPARRAEAVEGGGASAERPAVAVSGSGVTFRWPAEGTKRTAAWRAVP